MADPTVVMGVSPKRGAWLFVTNGPQAGRDFRLGDSTTIGSDPSSCDAILQDRTISARHAQLKREGNAFVIYDLASKNGTWVNNERVQKLTLDDDDEITLGSTTLIFKITPIR